MVRSFPSIWDDHPDTKAGLKAEKRGLLNTPNCEHESHNRPGLRLHQGRGNRGVEKRIIYINRLNQKVRDIS
ncbi:MAG: hypothetical protein QNJ60_06750 [Xenococcaceae cyanobacterium MO_188.B19]|nr:hypothetical protein [Xenococcaceae cyanobacterium MO_188.B19]